MRIYRCAFCSFRSFSRDGLEIHDRKHRVKSPHQCRICSYSTESDSRLAEHMKRDHAVRKSAATWNIPRPALASSGSLSKRSASKAASSSGRVFICNHCDYRSTDLKYLERHEKHHQVASAYRCPMCNFSASRMGSVTKHVNLQHKSLRISQRGAAGDEEEEAEIEIVEKSRRASRLPLLRL